MQSRYSPDWDDIQESNPASAESRTGSPGFDHKPLLPDFAPTTKFSAPETSVSSSSRSSKASTPAPVTDSWSVPQKRKNEYSDQICETSELERANRLSIVEMQTRSKIDHQVIKEDKRRKTLLDVEHSQVRSIREEGIHSSQEAERRCQHELAIWDKKLELARLQAGPSPGFTKLNPTSAYENTDVFGSTGEMSGQHSPYSSSPSSSGLHLSPDLREGYSWGSQTNTGYGDLMGSG